MYAVTETEYTREIDFEFADGSYFIGNVNLGIYWDGDWKLQWAEGILADAEDNQIQFNSSSEVCQTVIRKLNDEIAFRRRATDWAEAALQEHKEEMFYDYQEE